MVQVDVFWAYGIGATMAAAAGKKLEKKRSLWLLAIMRKHWSFYPVSGRLQECCYF
jgi:hypothetical protein